jgi:pyruvate kinase
MEIHRPNKRTKIVATLGPASDNENTLRKMILAGLDVVRINFSHSRPEYLTPLITLVRKLSNELQVPVAIMGDLRGPRIRVGEVDSASIKLEEDYQIVLTAEPLVGTAEKISISYPDLAQDVQIGSRLLLDDGKMELEVEEVRDNGDVVARVMLGGWLSSHKGVNLPGLRVSLPSITKKDFDDVEFAITNGFDFLALSFVQSTDDVRQLNEYLAEKRVNIPVIAKIERKSALDDIENIVKEAYGVMVARGDLALEMSIQDVPIAQKRIIAVCRQNAVPVITATQMLESMIHANKPTRAEATDVANAILDGTDALMLSAETAVGEYPVETIATMSSIAANTERAWMEHELAGPAELHNYHELEAIVAYASHLVATQISARAIVTYTASGATARRIACHRPSIPILALSAFMDTRRRLALSWGVETAMTEHINNTDHMVTVAVQQAQFCQIANPGDVIVMTAGTPPYGKSGRTNTLKVEIIPGKKMEDEPSPETGT